MTINFSGRLSLEANYTQVKTRAIIEDSSLSKFIQDSQDNHRSSRELHNKKFRACIMKGFSNILQLALFNAVNNIVGNETGVSL